MHRRERIQAFTNEIWHWYASNKRTLPWRDLPDTDPALRAYKVMVSEIMLQQTQVNRVKIVFKQFIERFTTIADLASASNRQVLLAWRGMGYNSRALRLRDAARVIFNSQFSRPNGSRAGRAILNFPQSMEELLQIPGIGHYTAAAIRNFAFNIPTPCIDTNIRRILHRTFVGPEYADGTWEKDDTYLLALAEEILDSAVSESGEKRDAANWYAALMDFGSLVQTKRNPRWDICPLTAKGMMKTKPAQWKKIQNSEFRILNSNTEPGRFVGTRYIPNRIFRGKVVEELRDAPQGLSLATIGKRICLDWSPREHRRWLKDILRKLETDRMLVKKKGRFSLMD